MEACRDMRSVLFNCYNENTPYENFAAKADDETIDKDEGEQTGQLFCESIIRKIALKSC